MKILLLKKTQWSVLAAVLAAAGLAAAALGPVHYRLGGAFIGSPKDSGGLWWSGFQAPLDSAGKTAALRVGLYSYPPEMAQLVASLGYDADAVTEATGQLAMISNDTAIGSLVWYSVKQGNPPVVELIWTWTGITTWTSPDTYIVSGTNTAYDVTVADQDHDGLPDPGAPYLAAFPWGGTVKRVLP
jgi:hypothetical protein